MCLHSGVLLLLVVGLGGLAPMARAGDDPRRVVTNQFRVMTNPTARLEIKERAAETIRNLGVTAIPLLIDHLKDAGHYAKAPDVPGTCLNLPLRAPVPPECGAPRRITIGEKCEELLYTIVMPSTRPPSCRTIHAKVWFSRPFVVPDWAAWWSNRKGATLAALHAQATTLIDQFCRAGGHATIEWK